MFLSCIWRLSHLLLISFHFLCLLICLSLFIQGWLPSCFLNIIRWCVTCRVMLLISMIYIDSTGAFRKAGLLIFELGQDLSGRILSLSYGTALRSTNLDWILMLMLGSHGFTLVPSWVVVSARVWYFLKAAMISAYSWMARSVIHTTWLSPSSCLGLLWEHYSPWKFVLWLGQ